MKLKIIDHPTRINALLSYDEYYFGDRIEREFCVPKNKDGRYIWELHENGRRTQPCSLLASRGSTLIATTNSFAEVLRAEYRAMRRLEASFGCGSQLYQ